MVLKFLSFLKIAVSDKVKCPRASYWKPFIAFGVFAAFLFSAPTFAQSNSQTKSGLKATVISDGAAVYEKPDFDSKVIEFVPFQSVIAVSRKAFAGTDGLGLFHKTRVRGKIGYIPDTDIRVGEKEREKEQEKERERERVEPSKAKAEKIKEDKPKSMAWDKDEEDVGKAPLYLTRFLGGAISRVNFTEKFSGRKLSDQITMYGMRMTGPGTLFDGPPLDMNVWFSMQKPKYYDVFSSNLNGFLMFGDVMAMLPIVNLDDWVLSYGLGVMWTFTKYRVQIRGENTDSLEFRIGLDLGLGLGTRIGKTWMVRGDAKYYYEKTQYLGYILSLQKEY